MPNSGSTPARSTASTLSRATNLTRDEEAGAELTRQAIEDREADQAQAAEEKSTALG